MWHTGDKHKSQLGLTKCAALMALGAWVAEKGLNSSCMRDLLSDWLVVWTCRYVVRLRRWSGSWVKCCSISFSCPDTGDYPFSWCLGFNSDCWCNWAEWVLPTVDTVHPWSKCHVLYLSVLWHFCRAVRRQHQKCGTCDVTRKKISDTVRINSVTMVK